jgi:6-phosphofructokinase 1
MAELVGNLLVAQSGGPTAVLNASVAGIIQEAGRHECVEEIYGGLHGIWGILNEDLIDLNDEKAKTIEGLKYAPAAALGTCRYKLDFKKKPDQAAKDLERLFEVFQAHNIRYFFYCGGNDSQDTANKIHHEAVRRAYELRVIGVPKTIDNDLPHTDHAPGYGSVIKYSATTVMEIAADVGSMSTEEGSCTIIEVMGRQAGWVAAGTVLAKRAPQDAPHVILTPKFHLWKRLSWLAFRRSSSRIALASWSSAKASRTPTAKRCPSTSHAWTPSASGPFWSSREGGGFGHPKAQGESTQREARLRPAGGRAFWLAPWTSWKQRLAAKPAVRAAMEEKSGYMVKLVRMQSEPYKWTTDLQPLDDIANVAHPIPRDWFSDDGFPAQREVHCLRASADSREVKVPMEGGLPKYVALERSPVEKKLPPRA